MILKAIKSLLPKNKSSEQSPVYIVDEVQDLLLSEAEILLQKETLGELQQQELVRIQNDIAQNLLERRISGFFPIEPEIIGHYLMSLLEAKKDEYGFDFDKALNVFKGSHYLVRQAQTCNIISHNAKNVDALQSYLNILFDDVLRSIENATFPFTITHKDHIEGDVVRFDRLVVSFEDGGEFEYFKDFKYRWEYNKTVMPMYYEPLNLNADFYTYLDTLFFDENGNKSQEQEEARNSFLDEINRKAEERLETF